MNEIHTQTWKLEELARQAGVSARTVRYYVQRGLLPAPVFRGRDTAYSREHLLRLQAIRRLQEHFVSLDAIQQELARRSPEEIAALISGQEAGQAPAFSPQQPWPLPLASAISPPAAGVPDGGSERWHRWVLAPGLELHLAESADAATQQQAVELLRAFRRQQTTGEYS